MGEACCSACAAAGTACAGAGCPLKAAGAASSAPEHPVRARSRAITGAHHAPVEQRRRAAGGLFDLSGDTEVMGYQPTAAELESMGIDRGTWTRANASQRLVYISMADGAGAGGGGSGPGHYGDERDYAGGSGGSAGGGDSAFLAEIESVTDPAQRAALLRERLRQAGASDEQIRAGVFHLAEGGLSALSSWLNSDLQRDLAQITAAASTARARAHEDGQTARAEIEAQAAIERARLEIESRERMGGNAPAQGNGMLYFMGGVALLAVIAALYKSSEK